MLYLDVTVCVFVMSFLECITNTRVGSVADSRACSAIHALLLVRCLGLNVIAVIRGVHGWL